MDQPPSKQPTPLLPSDSPLHLSDEKVWQLTSGHALASDLDQIHLGLCQPCQLKFQEAMQG